MAIYRNVHVSFWSDTKVLDDMTPENRYFMLYLLTNPHTNQVGCFEISRRQMSNETGYSIETIDNLLERFEQLGMVKYSNETKEMLILNWYKYNWTSSPKVIACIKKELLKVKNKEFVKYIKSKLNKDDDVELYRMVNKTEIPITMSRMIMMRDNNACQKCGSKEDLTIDHIIPRSMGGTNEEVNLRVLCRSCNSKRPVTGTALLEELKKEGNYHLFDTLSSKKRYPTHTHTQEEQEQEQEQEQEEKKKNKQKKNPPTKESKSSSKFIPPTLEEVSAYCLERKNKVDPKRFLDHYKAGGWMRGKTKIKDWKACVRTWERNQTTYLPKQKGANASEIHTAADGTEYDRHGVVF